MSLMSAPEATPSAPARTGPQAAAGPRRVHLLLYSDDVATRDAVRLGVGRRPARDVEVASWRECATHPAVIEAVEHEHFDLLILDGEATPMGGMGLCRQLKNEIFECPPGGTDAGDIQFLVRRLIPESL